MSDVRDLGPWDPMPIEDACRLFSTAGFRWWVSGGHALDLHVGKSWRTHDDTDIGIARDDIVGLAQLLDDWDLHVGAEGSLTRWDRGPLRAEMSQNNLWCRWMPTDPWCLDVTIGDGNHDDWIYRRDPTLRRPWSDAILHTRSGIPYLAPELQLLFKSKNVRTKDMLDATTVIPLLSPDRRTRLASYLDPGHPWQTIVARNS